MEYKAEKIEGTRNKYFVYCIDSGECVATLEDINYLGKGWVAWSWEDGDALLRSESHGESLESLVARADEWIA